MTTIVDDAPPIQRAGSVPRTSGAREAYLDNLRWSMVILVLSMHAVDTYSPFGNWYYGDKAATGATATMVFGTYQSFLQSFFMSLLFAVSGYFARPSLERKGRVRFMRERSFRLGVPVLLYMLVIGPLTEFYIAHSWRPPAGTPFLVEWLRHIQDGEVYSESGPLWFCIALLAFSLVYAWIPWSAATREEPPIGLTLPRIAVFAAVMAAGTFVVRLVVPQGVVILNLPLGDFFQYALMFAAGVLAHRDGWADHLDATAALHWLSAAMIGGLAGWLALIAFGGALEGHFEIYEGGSHWQAFAKAAWESYVCVTMSLGLVALYRERLNFSNRLFAFLSANAFAVYVFHPPIVVAVAHALHGANWPVGDKVVLLWIAAVVCSYAFASLVARRIPLLRAAL